MSNFAWFGASELIAVAGPMIAQVEAGTLSSPGPWRPPEWGTSPALFSITVPATQKQVSSTLIGGTDATQGQPVTTANTPTQVLVFDGILRAQHSRMLRSTDQPIQTNANSPVGSIPDHAFIVAPRITLEIGMSDAMASYSSSLWTSNASKSVSAYQTLVQLQWQRVLVTLTTRLDTYSNMIVEEIHPIESAESRYGLRASVTFKQQFLAGQALPSANSSAVASARPQATGQTPGGTVQTSSPSNALQQQHDVSSQLQTLGLPSNIPGAGLWSSTNTSSLGSFF